jgi:competence protein ComEA
MLTKKQINEINIIQGETSATVKGEDSDQVEIEKININEADITELDKLPGVGPARAQDIIDYRDQNAGFDSIEEIKNIKGIGDATFEKMKDMISVD